MPGGTAAEAATEGKAAAEAAAGEKTDAVWESRHARTASAAARSKPMGHAAEEGPEAAGVQLPHRRAQSRSGLAVVSAVAGKSDGGKAVFGHTSKGNVLARTLQDFLLNLKLYTNMKHSANCLASFLGGALVGAVVAMLVTPKSGPEFREDIRDMAKKGTRKLKNEIDKIHCDCNGLDCDCDKDE